MQRFSSNSSLIGDIDDVGVFNPIALISIPLAVIYYIVGLSLVGDNKDLEWFRTMFWIGMAVLATVIILFIVAFVRVDYLRQTKCGGILCGFAGMDALISLFAVEKEYEDLKNLSITFFILFVAVFVGEVVYPKISSKKNEVIIDNLKKCYLQLSENTVSGISFGDVRVAGDGSYFEIEYSAIRDVRTSFTSASSKQYYNLFIDSKYGTYKLSVQNDSAARRALDDAIANGGIKCEEKENSTAQEKTEKSVRSREGSWVCQRCGRTLENFIMTCGCGEQRPFEIESNNVHIVENNKIICPKCKQKQDSSRTTCFKCGFEFNK